MFVSNLLFKVICLSFLRLLNVLPPVSLIFLFFWTPLWVSKWLSTYQWSFIKERTPTFASFRRILKKLEIFEYPKCYYRNWKMLLCSFWCLVFFEFSWPVLVNQLRPFWIIVVNCHNKKIRLTCSTRLWKNVFVVLQQ